MEKLLLLIIFTFLQFSAQGQTAPKPFVGEFQNEEENIFIKLDLYNKKIIVPRQEMLGEVDGYIGHKKDTRVWMIVDSEIKDNQAIVTIINNYGTDDIEASLTYSFKDDTITLKQTDGATIRYGVNGKWVKISKNVKFKRINKQ